MVTGNDITQLILSNAEILVCEHCKQQYGTIPDIEGIAKTLQVATFRNDTKIYYRDRIHCVKCGMCEEYVQKETLYHPLADAPICKGCYQSFKDSDSCYTFEEDLGDFE